MCVLLSVGLTGCLSLLKSMSRDVGLTPDTDASANTLTAFLQKPVKRRSSLRASSETPLTVPLSVNSVVFIIDETFTVIMLPSSSVAL